MNFVLSLIVVALAAIVLFLATATTATASTPSSVIECTAADSRTTFCDALLSNLTEAIQQQLAPGATAAVALFKKPKSAPPMRHQLRAPPPSPPHFPGYSRAEKVGIFAAGRFTYDDTSALQGEHTLYDMASVTKCFFTTTAIAMLYQKKLLDVSWRVSDERLLGSAFAAKGKGDITVYNLLTHSSGFPPDPVPSYLDPNFNGGACANNQLFHPARSFSCMDLIYSSMLNQSVDRPPNTKYVYSDLNFIALAYIVSKIAVANKLLPPQSEWLGICSGRGAGNWNDYTCPFAIFVDTFILKRWQLDETTFAPMTQFIKKKKTKSPLSRQGVYESPPLWESELQHAVLQASCDDNCFASGGVQGHAGAFSTIRDTLRFLTFWIADFEGAGQSQDPEMLNADTIRYFTTIKNITQSSLAFGWNTMAPNNEYKEYPIGHSQKVYGHTGYAGTMVGIAPDLAGDEYVLALALLSNSRYDSFGEDKFIEYRRAFSARAAELLR